MVLIGIDPHKATHTAVAVDREETALGELTVKADCHQVERLLKWAIDFPERRWAIESANGLGFLLAQQLVAAGEDVVDVPPMLAARVRVLGSGKSQKNDPNDSLSTAIAALRSKRLRTVVAENHGAALRLLADHHHDLGSLRTQAVCRLHALVRCLVPGGTGLRLSADRAAVVLRSVRPTNAVDVERKHMALGFVADIRRLDAEIAASKVRIETAVAASGTSVTELYGVGPVVAAFLIERRHDPFRQQGSLRLLQRHGSHRSLERSEGATPTQPPGQPATQPRHPCDRHLPDPQPGRRAQVLRSQGGRRQDVQRSVARPQASDLERRVSPVGHRLEQMT